MHRKYLACAWCRELGSPEAEPETRIHGKVIIGRPSQEKPEESGRGRGRKLSKDIKQLHQG